LIFLFTDSVIKAAEKIPLKYKNQLFIKKQ